MEQSQNLMLDFLPAHFTVPVPHTDFTLVRKVAAAHEGMRTIFNRDPNLPLRPYLDAQSIEIKWRHKFRAHNFDYTKRKVEGYIQMGCGTFMWQGSEYTLYQFTWPEVNLVNYLFALVFASSPDADGDDAAQDKPGEDLLNAAYAWTLALKEELWVFSNGWRKDKALWDSIQQSRWDGLVLDPAFVENLKRDTETFFSGKGIYEALEIPWKRGILLLGPPGNGKTESIKVLLRESKITSLYVKSFNNRHGVESGIRAIFDFARVQAPCILVLEDLDSMVKAEIRSLFLNEMDGIDKNDGILVIATTNHPERIDDAIMYRPSRFDVKYTFSLPSPELRRVYIDKWIVKVKKVNGLAFGNEQFVTELVERTEGFSFALMKELFVSFLLRVAHDKAIGKESGDPEVVMKSQLDQLLVQVQVEKRREDTNGRSAVSPARSGYSSD